MALRTLLALLGLGCALLLAEGLARVVGRGAFPFLDVYETDARYGVRLAPDATARIRSRGGHVTTVTTNALGFRGDPAPQVLLLGDSMVLGYGVDDADAMAAQLGSRGVPTLAAAVPSWGPEESARAAEELVPPLAPRVVVFFAHLGNDWLEADVPNVERSAAEDGWLVRRRARAAEDAPLGWPASLRRSHLALAVRELDARARRPTAAQPSLGAPAAEQMLRQLPTLAASRPPHHSRLGRHLARVRQACAGRCTVVVALLPMDVQVDPTAWSKYRRSPQDLRALDALSTGLLADAADLPHVDLSLALAQASPGAFLPDDPHLSPRGHQVVADALLPFVAAPRALVSR